VRLQLYETRRQAQLKALRNELPYHTNVVRFIEDQISTTPKIDLRRKTEEECGTILATSGYARIDESFEYILKLPVRSFTAEQVAKHKAKLDSLRAEIATLEGKDAADLWVEDLRHV
jgi:hypothetical protein